MDYRKDREIRWRVRLLLMQYATRNFSRRHSLRRVAAIVFIQIAKGDRIQPGN